MMSQNTNKSERRAEKNGRDNMDVSSPRKIKVIENIRNWWKYRNAPLTISIDDEGLVILGGVVNQRVIADCDIGIGKDLLMRKQLDVRNLVNAGGGTWTTESPHITTSGCFENFSRYRTSEPVERLGANYEHPGDRHHAQRRPESTNKSER